MAEEQLKIKYDMTQAASHNRLTIEKVRGASSVTTNRFVQPFRILNPSNSGEFAQIYLSNYGGGFVQGDRIDCEVTVGDGAAAYIGTQANTRVYSPDPGQRCGQGMTGTVGEDGQLIIWPDPLVLHADSTFEQTQDWSIKKSSSLILLDIIGPGRMNDGELFAYRLLSTSVTVRVDDQPFLRDNYRFDPSEDTPTHPGHYGQYRFLLSLYMIAENIVQHEPALAEALTEGGFLTGAHERKDATLVSLNSHHDDGIILRALLGDSLQVDRMRSLLSHFISDNGLSGSMQWGRRY